MYLFVAPTESNCAFEVAYSTETKILTVKFLCCFTEPYHRWLHDSLFSTESLYRWTLHDILFFAEPLYR